jgi:hypothetical protein
MWPPLPGEQLELDWNILGSSLFSFAQKEEMVLIMDKI